MNDPEAKIERLREAFAADGFAVPAESVIVYRDRVGIRAIHRTARAYEGGVPKTAYYIEGTPFEMGFLMGRLAEPETTRMTEMFIDRVFLAMFREAVSGERLDFVGTRGPRLAAAHRLLIGLMRDMIRVRHVRADIPVRYHREIRGIVAGCREAARREGRSTAVSAEALWVLNAGLDCILSRTYTGILLPKRLRPKDLWMPIACNGFAILNDAASGGPLFGRDFMFPTGGIYHEVAAHVVCNPVADREDDVVRPFVSMTAPGIIGTVAGMNCDGVAGGVNMAVGANCDPSRPGFNSLLLLRDAIERARNIKRAVERIVDARRGVTCEYIFAGVGVHGGADRACVVEAGASTDDMAFLDYPGDRVKPLLPDETFLERHRSTDVLRGAMVRWDDYQVPQEYLEFNGDLCERFRRSVPDTAFEPIGRINRTPTDRIAPAGTTSLRPGAVGRSAAGNQPLRHSRNASLLDASVGSAGVPRSPQRQSMALRRVESSDSEPTGSRRLDRLRGRKAPAELPRS